MSNLFIIISSCLALISPIVYSRSIIWGQTKPHRTTRFTILVTTILGTTSLLAQGNHVAVWLAGVSALQAIFLFFLSLKHGMGGWSKSDMTCLVISLAGIVAWQTTTNPIFGLAASILADFAGMVPAIIKTYHRPETEIASFYILDTLAGVFSLLAIKNFIPQEIAYPIYIALINLTMAALAGRRRYRPAI